VDLDVISRCTEKRGIVPEQAEREVAPLAQQGPDEVVRVIMIEMLWTRLGAESAPVALLGPDLLDGLARDPVLAHPVRLIAGPVVTTLALAPVTGRGSRPFHVLLEGDRLLARGTPPESLGYP